MEKRNKGSHMQRQTIVTLTDENREELKRHSMKTLNSLGQSISVLKENLCHNDREVRDGAIVMTAAISMAVEEAIKQATDELKKK